MTITELFPGSGLPIETSWFAGNAVVGWGPLNRVRFKAEALDLVPAAVRLEVPKTDPAAKPAPGPVNEALEPPVITDTKADQAENQEAAAAVVTDPPRSAETLTDPPAEELAQANNPGGQQ